MGPKSNQRFDLYRQNLPAQNKFAKVPTLQQPSNNLHSTNFNRNIQPNVKRQYGNQKKRYTSSDMSDNGNEGSLWSGAGQENYLFSRNNVKRQGDIVVIQVQDKLKKNITLELSRAFPDMLKKKKKGEKEEQKNADAAGEQDKEPADPAKIYDKISSVVIEEINNDHMLLRGRKDVLYKQKRRLVEVQALIARRDISDEDSVLSNNVLESTIAVLR